jgi:hypothetical protein
VKVTDNVGVSLVEARISLPGSGIQLVPLTEGAGQVYRGTYNAPPNLTAAPEVYGVVYRAVDTAGNQAQMDCGSFTVRGDDQAPVLTNCEVQPRELGPGGGQVTLRVKAVDNVAVSEVKAVITRPTGGPVTVVLAPKGGDVYRGEFPAPPNAGAMDQVYGVTFEAEDALGNHSELDCGTFRVAAAGPPVIKECSAAPRSLPRGGGTVKLSARIHAEAGVEAVDFLVRSPDGDETQVPATSQSGEFYQAQFSIPPNSSADPATYSVAVRATDRLLRTTLAECGEVVVAGGLVAIRSAILRLFRPNESQPVARVLMRPREDGSFRARLPNLRPGRYRAEIKGFASRDGTGPVIATGSGTAEVQANRTVTLQIQWQRTGL